MYNHQVLKFTLIPIQIALASFHAFSQQTLDIKISNIQKSSGKVVVEIYQDEASWLESPHKQLRLSPDEDIITASFDVPHGKYAISIYQDVNENGELDRNFVGIPKEPVGFGNNYKPFGKPKFESASVEHQPASELQEIALYEVF